MASFSLTKKDLLEALAIVTSWVESLNDKELMVIEANGMDDLTDQIVKLIKPKDGTDSDGSLRYTGESED